MKNIHKINQNIYITSDEEIKEGEWCMVTPFGVDKFAKVIRFKKENGTLYNSECKKIILTTDQDLIADGIEQISEDVLLKIVEHIKSGKNIESFNEL